MRIWRGFSFSVGFLLLAADASAADDALDLRLDYAVGDGCPNEGTFRRAVRARISTARLADAPVGAWRVTAARDTSGVFSGRLVVRQPTGEEAIRDVDGDTCAEVVSALALIGALTIDPNASTAQRAEESTATPPPPAEPREAGAPATPRRGIELGAGANADFNGGVTPDATPSLGVFVEARARRAGFFSPTVRGGFSRSFETTTSLSGSGSAAFTFMMGTLDLCPSRWVAGRFSATGCVRGELGVLRGEGRDIEPPRDDSPLWLAVDGLARGEIGVAGPVSIELAAGVRMPLLRTRYIFQPDTTVFRAQPVGWLAEAGAAVHFR